MLRTAVRLESVGILESSRSIQRAFLFDPLGVLPSAAQLGIWASEGLVPSLLMALPRLLGKPNYPSDVIPSETYVPLWLHYPEACSKGSGDTGNGPKVLMGLG